MGAEHKCPCCGEMCTTWGLSYRAFMEATTELDKQGNTTNVNDAHEQSTDEEDLSCLKCGGWIEWNGDRLIDQCAGGAMGDVMQGPWKVKETIVHDYGSWKPPRRVEAPPPIVFRTGECVDCGSPFDVAVPWCPYCSGDIDGPEVSE
jgi:hypothetical protein